MAERAHPDDPRFEHFGWRIRLRRGWLPWVSRPKVNPYRAALEARYAWVNKFASRKRVLDIPCGTGWGTSMIQGASRLVGVDLDTEAVAFATSRYGKVASFEVGSMEKLTFSNGSFDIVACMEGIEHVPVAVGQGFLDEANRVLSFDGELFLSSPYCATGGHSGNPYHIHEYEPAEMRQLLERRFIIVEEHSRPVDNLIVQYFRAKKRY
jgi:2-polyprenyl-3-methyl-5-hydroxy-6-metoxy-1,4-benzoquinol methylase